jgi:hypothetical protein
MSHYSEEELIAYQLHESSEEREIRAHLENCLPCAAVSDAVAETLRIYSAERVPEPDFERNWERLRGNLTVLEPEPQGLRRFARWWVWPVAGLACAALLLVAFVGVRIHRPPVTKPNYAINGHGPLTTQPVDPAIANHLDAAERLLTEVNHASGPLDDTTRSQAHDLLLKNAVYVRTAQDKGDYAEAAVLDNLGRVLTTIDNSPPEAPHSLLRFRLEMNTDGLLLDIRILRQNDDRQ